MNEPLNIISNSIFQKSPGGPAKVVINTIKGLEKLNYPYVLNNDPRQFRYNWVHDSLKGLIQISLLKIPAVVGPNLVVLPAELPRLLPGLEKCIYLHPSQWCIDLWKRLGFDECELSAWPAGIDSESFGVNRKSDSRGNVLIYFKRRNALLLEEAISLSLSHDLTPHIIKYGEYNERQYKEVLSKCEFGIWIGISESQGIALQEALSSNLPLIVCDVNSLFESFDKKDHRFDKKLSEFKPTSVPYFDSKCGLIIDDFSKLGKSIEIMKINSGVFQPALFISENLSLENQAMKLLSFFKSLELRYPDFFTRDKVNYRSAKFSLSLAGHFIHKYHILPRKIKTLIRLIKSQ